MAGINASSRKKDLNTISLAIGGQGKPTGEDACEGAKFAAMWMSGDPVQVEKARGYLENDCMMVWNVCERMGIE